MDYDNWSGRSSFIDFLLDEEHNSNESDNSSSGEDEPYGVKVLITLFIMYRAQENVRQLQHNIGMQDHQ